MKRRFLPFVVALCCATISLQCDGESGSFTTPFIDIRSQEKDGNALIYEPLIYMELINPSTKKSITCFGYFDTGSDRCFIKKEFADRLGLKPDGQPPHEMQAGGGTILLHSTVIEYTLKDPNGDTVESFPVQRSPFFIQDGWLPVDVVLGNVGFLDRFKEVRISYPREIILIW